MEVRPAIASDHSAILEFTRDTFDWGDYVSDSFLSWLEDEHGQVLVAADADDRPVGVARVVMLSDREAWMHAARVSPLARRTGVATMLNVAGCDWARQNGADVARLLVEDWNTAAQQQVAKMGYRRGSVWVSAEKAMAMEPLTNGGRRVPGDERLTPARRTEVDLAWMTWKVGDLAQVGRELIPIGWAFRQMTVDDLRGAVGEGRLWQCPSGWMVAAITDDGRLDVSWLETNDLDAHRLIKAMIDLADGFGVETIWGLFPAPNWLVETLSVLGFELRPSAVWSLPL